ncbi:hypothetical protein [Microbispora sp. GKU 823]|uniref:hypothetical protein n=1 Tax=Microbispora sp. GKU 823 TaxID=1652100 RepID=UPI0009A2BB04|nr:hypothetical protein [Microbispora sp. GKU 823]OPG13481.1 hypothetical protein B1L11_08405 [Microbispora sp. GKU 823]
MGGLLAELGKKLAERWLTLLVLPGALYLAALVAAATLGHAHPFDERLMTTRLDQWTVPYGTGRAAVLLTTFLLGSAAAGVAAQALAAVVERLWLAEGWGSWPPPLRQAAARLTRRRRSRWSRAVEGYHQAREDAAAALARARLEEDPVSGAPGRAAPPSGLDAARRRLRHIGTEEPERPTWMGDRMQAVATRLDRELDLDLATVWPYLWLTVPETVRAEITAARETLGRATTLAGWGLLYAAVGALWWPGLLIAAVVLGTGWRRARTAVDAYAELVEATVRLRTAALAGDLGLEHTGPLSPATGKAVTDLLRHRGPVP